MASLQQRRLITSLQLARLSLARILYSASGLSLKGLRDGMATSDGLGDSTDMSERRVAELAWELAMMAQSCAYLATELQVSAERLLVSQITCPESTFSALFSSAGIARHLIENMRQSFAATNAEEDLQELPVLSTELVAAIRSSLARGQAITTVGYTTSGESQETSSIDTAGDMR